MHLADVAKLVDAIDSKSFSSNRVLVRVQSSAKKAPPRGSFAFFADEVSPSRAYVWTRSEGRLRPNRLPGRAKRRRKGVQSPSRMEEVIWPQCGLRLDEK